MKRVLFSVLALLAVQFALPFSFAAEAVANPGPDQTDTAAPSAGTNRAVDEKTAATAAAAAVVAQQVVEEERPDFLEHMVDLVLRAFDIRTSGNTATHYVIAALFLVAALLARRIVTGVLFPQVRKLASRTDTTFDDRLLPAIEGPAAAFVMLCGIFGALKVLKLPPETDTYIRYGLRIAYALVMFWAVWRALAALLDHAHEVARSRNLGVAAFMGWIKKSLLTIFAIVAVLLTIQSFGYDVKALLAGLGIGGLAFALAAQDTLANFFGSIVVAVDQPFKVGEAIRIAGNVGIVEEIGLRSTRLRMIDKSLMIIPNKTVASEMITNFSRFTRRRHEQVIGLTYDTPPDVMDAVATEFRELIKGQPEVDPASVMVFWRDFSASSLDLWVVYELKDPDFQKAMFVRQRVNVAMAQIVQRRGLSFAFPSQTVYLEGQPIRQIAERGARPEPRPPGV